jgi:hypothetical protein
MKVQQGMWILGVMLPAMGCQSEGFSSKLDASADARSLSDADRLAFCESASDYIVAHVTQEKFDHLAAVAQAAQASQTVEQCLEQIPTYLALGPYPAFSSCSGMAENLRGCAPGITVGELEDVVEQFADNALVIADKLSCDLVSEPEELQTLLLSARDVPEELKAARDCFISGN